MRLFDRLRLQLTTLFRRSGFERELDAELQYHLEQQIEENLAAGMAPLEARAAALRIIGGMTQFREECRDARRVNWLENLLQDTRYGLRQIGRSPFFTAVVVLSLALGIGANTAIYSVMNAYLLRPMPVDRPDRLVAIDFSTPGSSGGLGLSYPDLLDYRKADTGLAEIMGSTGIALSITGGEKPELIWGEIVTGNYFSGLGVRPLLGRGFLPEEGRVPGQKSVCVLNYHFWRKRFHSDPRVIGALININRHPFTIVGVAPHGFIGTTLFNFVPDVWVPVTMQQAIAPNEGDPLQGRDNRWINSRARLKDGVTRQQAEAALNIAAARLAKEYPQTNRYISARLMPAGARMIPQFASSGIVAKTAGLMTGVVILVLLIACANAGNLMLARAQARAREMATRIALGAGRRRLLRQMLTESLLLALIAGALGIVFATFFDHMLRSFMPTLDFQTADLDYEMRFDPRLLPFTIAIAALTTVLFGLAPALRASRVNPVDAIKGGAQAGNGRRRRFGRGNLLILAQVSTSSALLIWGGLFLRSLQYSQSADLGFHRSGILMFSVDLDLQGYTEAQGRVFQRALIDRLGAIAGVEKVSRAAPLPLDAYDRAVAVLPEGYVPRSDHEANVAGMSLVGPDYFETMGTPLVAGRPVEARDGQAAMRVAVINETLARRYWQTPAQAVGRRFRTEDGGKPIEVIGVARDGKYRMIGEPPMPYCFLALAQAYQGRTTVLLRSRERPQLLVPEIRAQVKALDAALPIYGLRTMPEFLERLLLVYQMGAELLGTFALVAVLLAAVGVFGVLHFTVVRRTSEIGIRMALGASRGRVLGTVLARCMALVAGGICIGVGAALAASGVTGSLVAGVSGSDPLTFCLAVLVFLPVAFVAVAIPARRAMRIEPVTALRFE